jgi:tetratricopeptide (TPR) repeat protein
VDHLIGLKLSQKYRFAEGAAHQRQALSGDAHYLPAKAQLAQDLLRLGQEAEGWRLAQEVHDQDGYDVAAYNLVTLHGTMGKYATLTNADFVVRMSAHEADVYGPRVLGLLGRAKQQLCAKYDLKLTQPIVVEIFPDPRDFGVRTFGLPDNPGFLGVCFGRVITANSPAQHTSHPVNWEAVLWHEFAHVVTLHLTRNRMPRWLSEGISVYEERQAHRGWGQDLTPRYRQKILDGELTPIAQLSGAFLSPKSAADLDFAYFQSSLVVEFLVTRFGLDRLKSVLADLGEGREINRALEKHAAPLATLEPEFEAFARRHAEALAPRLDWEEPGLELLRDADGEALAAWLKARPTNFWALMREGQRLLDASQWREAQAPLRQVIERFPAFTGPDNAYALLARSYRALHETNAELDVLSRLAAEDAAAPEAYQRLMELCAARQDWTNVIANARRYLAVNPLVSLPYRHLAEAAEALDCTGTAIEAYRALLKLNPSNPAEVHFRLARRLHARGDAEARQHLLEALEEAPRFREALQLLLEAHRTGSTQENARRTALPSEVSP